MADESEHSSEITAEPAAASGTYTAVGDRVAGILEAAEEAAEKIREETRQRVSELERQGRVEAERLKKELTEEARNLRPGLLTVQHVGFGVSIRRAAGAWGVAFENSRAGPRGIARAQALGLATTVFTVNEPRRMLELEQLGVTGIFTDRPDLARRTLGGQQG